MYFSAHMQQSAQRQLVGVLPDGTLGGEADVYRLVTASGLVQCTDGMFRLNPTGSQTNTITIVAGKLHAYPQISKYFGPVEVSDTDPHKFVVKVEDRTEPANYTSGTVTVKYLRVNNSTGATSVTESKSDATSFGLEVIGSNPQVKLGHPVRASVSAGSHSTHHIAFTQSPNNKDLFVLGNLGGALVAEPMGRKYTDAALHSALPYGKTNPDPYKIDVRQGGLALSSSVTITGEVPSTALSYPESNTAATAQYITLSPSNTIVLESAQWPEPDPASFVGQPLKISDGGHLFEVGSSYVRITVSGTTGQLTGTLVGEAEASLVFVFPTTSYDASYEEPGYIQIQESAYSSAGLAAIVAIVVSILVGVGTLLFLHSKSRMELVNKQNGSGVIKSGVGNPSLYPQRYGLKRNQ